MRNQETKKSSILRYQKLPELVKEQLMDWIMDGTISMGEKLNAEDIASRLGVSRMPVREALNSMEKSGIVYSKPYVGTKVVELQMTDIFQIYLMRQALEPLACYYACKSINDQDIENIEMVHKRLEEVIDQPEPDAKRIFVLNREFHFSIYEVSQMKYLINTISTLWDNLAFYKLIYGRKYAKDKNSAKAMVNEHRNYIEKLKERDAKGLKELVHESLGRRISELKGKVEYEI
ncbi:MAG: GntR family transcriptional regulator [Bacillota bacterium]